MINTASKNHTQIRKIEQGIAKQRLAMSAPRLARLVDYVGLSDMEVETMEAAVHRVCEKITQNNLVCSSPQSVFHRDVFCRLFCDQGRDFREISY